ncbi:NUDIX hydrolase [Phenylobacterium sp.]|uniref:NUDIX domain-containing protein n=1 Tax=Phenylobacterium sp. TaxID=1871053 RepID=UPI0027369130|nr:NUDIX hydrolase [Phenylobacterium sp.]MDP3658571.1 NUDIX hydrolase [Phenylobacterium sp.]
MSQKPNWLRAHGTPWKSAAERAVYHNPWIRLTEHDAVAPTGRAALYGVVRFANHAIAILPVHDDGTIILVGQNRFPLGDYSWEIPEGGAPLSEAPLVGARRELREETGLEAAEWREVLRLQLSNSVTDEQAFGYLATGLSPASGGAAPDETEQLATVRVPFREALDAALAGHMRDVLTVVMLLRGYHMAREGALPDALARAMLR